VVIDVSSYRSSQNQDVLFRWTQSRGTNAGKLPETDGQFHGLLVSSGRFTTIDFAGASDTLVVKIPLLFGWSGTKSMAASTAAAPRLGTFK